MPNQEPQHHSFQAFNSTNFPCQYQDLQVSNSNMRGHVLLWKKMQVSYFVQCLGFVSLCQLILGIFRYRCSFVLFVPCDCIQVGNILIKILLLFLSVTFGLWIDYSVLSVLYLKIYIFFLIIKK